MTTPNPTPPPTTAAAKPLKAQKSMLALSIMITGLGVAWLLSSLALGPNIDWVWTISLALVGIIVVFISGGMDKLSVVLGPVLWSASVLSVFRQTGSLRIEVEMPILLVIVGLLMAVAQHPAIPAPRWLQEPK